MKIALNHFILSLHDLHHLIKFMFGSIHIKIYMFVIYLLEDEHELSLGMLIRSKRIYNFLLFHVTLIPLLHIYIMVYRIFWTNLLTQRQVSAIVLCMFFAL